MIASICFLFLVVSPWCVAQDHYLFTAAQHKNPHAVMVIVTPETIEKASPASLLAQTLPKHGWSSVLIPANKLDNHLKEALVDLPKTLPRYLAVFYSAEPVTYKPTDNYHGLLLLSSLTGTNAFESWHKAKKPILDIVASFDYDPVLEAFDARQNTEKRKLEGAQADYVGYENMLQKKIRGFFKRR